MSRSVSGQPAPTCRSSLWVQLVWDRHAGPNVTQVDATWFRHTSWAELLKNSAASVAEGVWVFNTNVYWLLFAEFLYVFIRRLGEVFLMGHEIGCEAHKRKEAMDILGHVIRVTFKTQVHIEKSFLKTAMLNKSSNPNYIEYLSSRMCQ